MCNLKVEITSRKRLPSNVLDSDNMARFDLKEGFTIEETEAITETAKDGSINVSFAIAADFPETDKNRIIFDIYKKDIINVRIWDGADVLGFDQIQLLSYDANVREYSVTLISSHYLEKLSKIKLKDIDFGAYNSLQLDPTLVKQTWLGASGQLPIAFPVIDYGAWYDPSPNPKSVLMKDLRIFFQAKDVMVRLFALIGLEFKCSFLNSFHGKKWYAYILANLNEPSQLKEFGFKTSSNPLTIANNLTGSPSLTYFSLPNEAWDYGAAVGGYWFLSAATKLSGRYKIVVDFEGVQTTGAGGNDIILLYIVKDLSIIDTLVVYVDFTPRDYRLETFVEFDAANVLEFAWEGQNDTGIGNAIASKITVTVEAQRVWLSDGIIERWSKYIHKDYLAIDFVKGIAHLINGKFTKKGNVVYLSPSLSILNLYNASPAEPISGFGNVQAIDITPYQICESEKIEYSNSDQKRYLKLSFKGGTNPYTTADTFSKTHDFGAGKGYLEETEDSQNKFFEAAQSGRRTELELGVANNEFWMASLRDNTNGSLSFNLGAYMLYIQDGKPSHTLGTVPPTPYFKFENTSLSTCHTGYQIANIPYSGVVQKACIAYGDTPNDLFTIFYKETILKSINSELYTLSALLRYETYKRLQFTNKVLVSINEAQMICDLVSKSFLHGDISPSELIVRKR